MFFLLKCRFVNYITIVMYKCKIIHHDNSTITTMNLHTQNIINHAAFVLHSAYFRIHDFNEKKAIYLHKNNSSTLR